MTTAEKSNRAIIPRVQYIGVYQNSQTVPSLLVKAKRWFAEKSSSLWVQYNDV